MNSITIKFAHICAETPKHTFGARVAIKSNCDSSKWIIGRVTGLRLDEDNIWNYTIMLDYPQGFCEEVTEDELASEDELACLSKSAPKMVA